MALLVNSRLNNVPGGANWMLSEKWAWVTATLDTKIDEALYVCDLLEAAGVPVNLVDLSTKSPPSASNLRPPSSTRILTSAVEVAAHHPQGASAVFCRDRGDAVAAMADAFAGFVKSRPGLGGMLGIGGSGGTAIITRAMRVLPIGLPKLMVSTMASGSVASYVGACDITMMYSVTDVAGLNRISRRVLGNAAHALAGMILHRLPLEAQERPAVGLSMFGVTTPCVQHLVRLLSPRFDCLVFHATGTGGQSMEKLLDDGLIAGVIDITTTEVCDHLFGGILACTDDRFGAVQRSKAPYVGSCGALDMVNFGAMETVPPHYRARKLYRHNPQITLMRTTGSKITFLMPEWLGVRLGNQGFGVCGSFAKCAVALTCPTLRGLVPYS